MFINISLKFVILRRLIFEFFPKSVLIKKFTFYKLFNILKNYILYAFRNT